MNDYGTAIILEAKKWLNCKETKANRSTCVDAIHKSFSENWSGSADAWCAKFVYVIVGNASHLYAVTNPLPKTAGARDLLEKSKSKGIYVDNKPAPGCIFFKKSDSAGATGHVGFVIQVTSDGFYTIEGNSDDKVASRLRTVSSDMQFIHVENQRKIYFENSTYFLTFALIAGGGYLAWKRLKKHK